jgi:polyhydroxyalkanoate synthesis regulator phasin
MLVIGVDSGSPFLSVRILRYTVEWAIGSVFFKLELEKNWHCFRSLGSMAGFGDMVQKAFYLGVGLASYAGEKAGGKLTELRAQAQKLADEMVERGEMSTEDARRFIDEMMQQGQPSPGASSSQTTPTEPRRIEILDDEEPPKERDEDVDILHQQVRDLQEELRRLERES